MKRTMRTLLLCLALAAFCAGCGGEGEKPAETTTAPETTAETTLPPETTQPTTEATTEPTTAPTTEPEVVYIPEISPDTVGIYIPAGDGTRARVRVTEFSAKRTAKTDIDCFEILASREDRVEGSSFVSIWNTAWDSFEDGADAKIGFHIQFSLTSGEVVSATLLKPSDAAEFYDYLEIYMYDDIHQTPGAWYTHLSDTNMDEETIISSIKLTSGSKIAEVGDIILTAFVYNGGDCFDTSGNYIGLVSETITITE